MKLSDIALLSQRDVEALEQQGIRETSDLTMMAAAPEQRQRLAKATGIDEQLLLRVALITDLAQLEGIGAQTALLFEVCPQTRTVQLLANGDPEEIRSALQSANSKLQIIRHVPSVGQIKRLQQRAMRIRPLVRIEADSNALAEKWRSSERQIDVTRLSTGCATPMVGLGVLVLVIALTLVMAAVFLAKNSPSGWDLPEELESAIELANQRMAQGVLGFGIVWSGAFAVGTCIQFVISGILGRAFERRLTRAFMSTPREKQHFLTLLGPEIGVGRWRTRLIPWTEPIATYVFVLCSVPIAILFLVGVVGSALQQDHISDLARIGSLGSWGIVVGTIALTLLTYAPRLLYLVKRRRNFRGWSVAFERKWLTLWFLVGVTYVLAQIAGIAATISLVAWGFNAGTRLLEETWDDAITEIQVEMGSQLSEHDLIRGEEWLSGFHQEVARDRQFVNELIEGMAESALVPAFLSELFLILCYQVAIAALSRRGRILYYIAIQAAISYLLGKFAKGLALKLGVGTFGLMGIIYTVLTMTTSALAPDYVYGYIWQRPISCSYCGAEVDAADRFCGSCSYRLSN